MPDVVFTPSLFYKYEKCPHWIWHDNHTDPALKGRISELAERLIDQGNIYEREVIRDLGAAEVATDNNREAVAETVELMRAGAGLIYQGALEHVQDGVRHFGRPDLLERRDGPSTFADFHYVPIDIKSTRELKRTHRHQLTIYAFMLESAQGVLPAEGIVINRDGERLSFGIDADQLADTLATRDAILQIIAGTKPSLRLTSSCKDTPWYNACLQEAIESEDIALIYKLDSRSLDALRAAGVRTIHDAAAMDVDALPKIPYAGVDRLERAKLQAQALVDDRVIWRSAPAIPDAPLRLYFDIEGDPLLGIDYLFGVGIVDGQQEARFKFFLAEQLDHEERMWRQFLAWLDTLPADYVVYHYADYERSHLEEFKRRYGGSTAFDHFLARLVDLAAVVQESAILPLYFYSIKDIAKSRFLNYQWRHQQAGGAQSMFWFEQWLETGDRAILQQIIDYNEDDVVATECLHHWLMRGEVE